MLGSTTDAVEIAAFADSTGNGVIPKSPEAIDRLLMDMRDAGLVKRRSMPPNARRGSEQYHPVALTEDGWARARELEATDSSSSGG
jgi:DNA-binding PadR family transcriptional regulator